MNQRRRRRGPAWPRIAVAVVGLVLAILALVLLGRLITGALNGLRGGRGERDPQFAEPTQAVTRPPELEGEGKPAASEDDPSANWDLGEQTPVDVTAEELSRRAEAGQ